MAFFEMTGRILTGMVEGAGYTLILLALSFFYMKNIWKRRRFVMDQLSSAVSSRFPSSSSSGSSPA